MQWTAIVNPAAGRGRTRKLLPELHAACAASALDIDLQVPTSAEHGHTLARQAFAAGRGVLACGGDGTVGELAGIAAETDGLLALVPSGSGNDFARHLGFDVGNPLDSFAVLEAGRIARVDLGRAWAGGRSPHEAPTWFCTVASTGFDAAANEWANGVQRLRGTTLYIVAMLRTLATYKPRRFLLTVDGEAHMIESWLVAVGNSRSYGGGMRVTPNAALDDGMLDVIAVGPVSRARFLRTFPQVFKGGHVDRDEVQTWRGRLVEIESIEAGEGALELYASGDSAGALPARLEGTRGALRMVVPALAPVPDAEPLAGPPT
ncbi:MAG: diacylglycerol kinase catalytic region [Actinomycetia bacterium]|nr:diacylglycerol kinase catalytic region [Actinomycetes bacterium]